MEKTSTHPKENSNVPVLNVNLSGLPALISLDGINKHLCPMSRSLAYALATSGEIQTASIGMKRGARCYVTQSLAEWLQRRMAGTVRPNIAPRRQTTPAKERSA